ETVAALAASRALAGCSDASVSRVLRRIARDETRHAALAWRTIAWAVTEGGDPVIAALRAAASSSAPLGKIDGACDPRPSAHGRLDRASAHRANSEAWHQIIRPTLEEICGMFTRSASC